MEVQEIQYCVNCKVCVDRQKHYILTYVDDHRVVSLVSNWISPEIITDEDLICVSCYNTAVSTLNKFPVPEHPGQKKRCLLCTWSYENRQNHVILRDNPSDLEQLMIQIVDSETSRQITSSDRLCNPCFKKIKDKAITTLNNQEIAETHDIAVEVLVKNEPDESEKDPLQICEDIGVKTEPDALDVSDEKTKKNASKRKTISTDDTKPSGSETKDETGPNVRKNRRKEHINTDDEQNDDVVEDINDSIEILEDDQAKNDDVEIVEDINDSIEALEDDAAENNDVEIVEDINDSIEVIGDDGAKNDDVEIVEDINDSIEVLEDDAAENDDVQVVESPQEPEPKDTIHLPNYKRAANSSSHCFFFGCKSSNSRHTLGEEVRAVMLAKYNYYIPKNARVCFDHLSGDGWDTLNQTDSMNTFNAKQIEHMLSLVE